MQDQAIHLKMNVKLLEKSLSLILADQITQYKCIERARQENLCRLGRCYKHELFNEVIHEVSKFRLLVKLVHNIKNVLCLGSLGIKKYLRKEC